MNSLNQLYLFCILLLCEWTYGVSPIRVHVLKVTTNSVVLTLDSSVEGSFWYSIQKSKEVHLPSVSEFEQSTSTHLNEGENEIIVHQLEANTEYTIYYYALDLDNQLLCDSNLNNNSLQFVTSSDTSFSMSIQESNNMSIDSLPFSLHLQFTKSVLSLTKENIILTNSYLISINFQSKTLVELTLNVVSPGQISIGFKNIQSEEGQSLSNDITYTCKYNGASIMSTQAFPSSNYADIQIIVNKQISLFCFLSSSIPSSSTIYSDGKQATLSNDLSSITSNKYVYILKFTSLSPSSQYTMYCTGKDNYDIQINTTIEQSKYIFSTMEDTTMNPTASPTSSPSASPTSSPITSTCGKGWKDQICSGQGECINNQCKCKAPFSGPICSLLQCSLIVRPNITHTLLHVSMNMNIDYDDQYNYDTNDEDYETIYKRQKEEKEYQQIWLKMLLADNINFPVNQICIRVWDITQLLVGTSTLSAYSENSEQISESSERILKEVDSWSIHVPSDSSGSINHGNSIQYKDSNKNNHNIRGRSLQASQNIYETTLSLFMTLLVTKNESQSVLKKVIQYYQLQTSLSSLDEYGLHVNQNNITKAIVQIYDDPYTCYNNVIDEQETDIDCGGTCIQKCELDKACEKDEDCISTHCTNKLCQSGTIIETISNNKIYLILSVAGIVVIIIVIIFFVMLAVKKCKRSSRVGANVQPIIDVSNQIPSSVPSVLTTSGFTTTTTATNHNNTHKHVHHSSKTHRHTRPK